MATIPRGNASLSRENAGPGHSNGDAETGQSSAQLSGPNRSFPPATALPFRVRLKRTSKGHLKSLLLGSVASTALLLAGGGRALAECLPAPPASGGTVTCTGNQDTPYSVSNLGSLTVNVLAGANFNAAFQRGQYRHADHDDRRQSQSDDVHRHRQFVVALHRGQRQSTAFSFRALGTPQLSFPAATSTKGFKSTPMAAIASKTTAPSIREYGSMATGRASSPTTQRPRSTAASRALASATMSSTIPA